MQPGTSALVLKVTKPPCFVPPACTGCTGKLMFDPKPGTGDVVLVHAPVSPAVWQNLSGKWGLSHSRKPTEKASLAQEGTVPPTIGGWGLSREMPPCAWPLLKLLLGLTYPPHRSLSPRRLGVHGRLGAGCSQITKGTFHTIWRYAQHIKLGKEGGKGCTCFIFNTQVTVTLFRAILSWK